MSAVAVLQLTDVLQAVSSCALGTFLVSKYGEDSCVGKFYRHTAQYTFLMCRIEVFSFCAQYTFLCTVWKLCRFFAQYTFTMYRLGNVLFLCAVHIPDVPSGKCSVSEHSTHFCCTVCKVVKTVPVPVETCNRSSFLYECERYELLGLHPS